MNEAILSAIAARLGDLADVAFRIKATVEAGAPAAPFSILRMAVDVDAAASMLEGHVERLHVSAIAPETPR
jgi:hypothetical protein